jgi:hypothetical protein
MATQQLTRADYVGLGEIAKARQRLLVNMFNGTQLKMGTKSQASAAKSIGSDLKDVGSNVRKLVKGGSQAAKSGGGSLMETSGIKSMVQDFVVQCADVTGIDEVMAAIGAEAVQSLIAEVAPIVGILRSGYKLADAGKTVATDGYELYKSAEWKGGFLPGDAIAAAGAVQDLIKRDLGKHSIQLGQQALATGTKIGGLFADFGTATTAAIGLANALATLGLELFYLGLDIKDLRTGNKLLVKPDDLDLNVFTKCPILGCYLLTCADTSSVANFFVADIGLPGWMDRVEKLKKTQMDPMLRIATRNINASRLQLEGLASNKGTHAAPGFFAGVKSKAMKKLGMA